MTSPRLAPQLDAAARASGRLRLLREAARRESVTAIREVESAIVEALAGDVLRLPNVLPRRMPKLCAVAVRDAHHAVAKLHDGRELLVLGEHGRLELVRLAGGELSRRATAGDDLLAEDLALVVEAASRALELHVARADRTSASYRAALALARKVRGARLDG